MSGICSLPHRSAVLTTAWRRYHFYKLLPPTHQRVPFAVPPWWLLARTRLISTCSPSRPSPSSSATSTPSSSPLPNQVAPGLADAVEIDVASGRCKESCSCSHSVVYAYRDATMMGIGAGEQSHMHRTWLAGTKARPVARARILDHGAVLRIAHLGGCMEVLIRSDIWCTDGMWQNMSGFSSYVVRLVQKCARSPFPFLRSRHSRDDIPTPTITQISPNYLAGLPSSFGSPYISTPSPSRNTFDATYSTLSPSTTRPLSSAGTLLKLVVSTITTSECPTSRAT
ncbi:hypothetical protein A0H81_10599 [Grifola frondosa]|uniref:Uncharacterized protein n=1 Tax=Grifola frondosa TaxID=5627 RepID=A0A1C7LY11_GRIFR|nr:hypothetical protein A0H81_10599 [Grifola frondosa]